MRGDTNIDYSFEGSNISSAGTFGGRVASKFGNIFLQPSSDYFPSTLSSAFEYCRYLFYVIPVYKEVAKRTMRYFITDLECPGSESQEEKDKFLKFLKDELNIVEELTLAGDELACYGNVFYMMYYPFERILIDKRNPEKLAAYNINGKDLMALRHKIKFNLKDLTYTIPDPKNDYKGEVTLPFIDRAIRNKSGIKLVRLDCWDMRIKYNKISKTSRYIYIFPSVIKQAVQAGQLHYVNELPKSMLQALSKDKNFEFYNDEIFHLKTPSISGISEHGWGLPGPIANFRQIFQILVYNKTDEAIALDMAYPMRIITPDYNSGNAESNPMMMDLGIFKNEISKMIAKRRRDLFSMHASTFGIKYEEIGGNGKNYASKELLSYQVDNLLNCEGYPIDLFKASLNINQLPTAFRLFQQSFWYVYNGFNKLLKWSARKAQEYLKQQTIEVELQQPRYADNIELMNIKNQLVTSGILPWSTIFKDLGISDAKNAIMQRFEEDLEIEKEKTKKQEDMQRSEQAQDLLKQELDDGTGDAPAPMGGAPGQGGGILDKEQQAMQIAQQWMQIQDNGERRKQMESLKAQDQVMYALATNYLKEIRADMKSQGYEQMKQSVAEGQM